MAEFNNVIKSVDDCLNHVMMVLCYRCACHDNRYTGTTTGRPHHDGIVHTYLDSTNITYDTIDAYFSDLEHGYLHGICACIAAWMLKGSLTEQEIVSLLLHDILKCIDVDPKLHDAELEQHFPKLLPSTYTHSRPSSDDLHDILVMADREELHRYSDAAEWVNTKWPHRDNMDTAQLDYFYAKVRPVLERTMEGRDKVWIKHGLERVGAGVIDSLQDQLEMWPTHFYRYAGQRRLYAVETDKPPFSRCGQHSGSVKKWPWYRVQAYHVLEQRVKLIDKQNRDHLWCRPKYRTEEWVFLLADLTAYDSYAFLQAGNVYIATPEIVDKLFHIGDLLECRLKALAI